MAFGNLTSNLKDTLATAKTKGMLVNALNVSTAKQAADDAFTQTTGLAPPNTSNGPVITGGVSQVDPTEVPEVPTEPVTPVGTPPIDYTDPNQFSPSSWDQLGGMLSSDNPLMQAADTKGRQLANQAGLLNTSLAGQASQAAMVDAAQPFALQDAGTAAGLLSDRQQQELDLDKQRQMVEILRNQGAPEWMFNVMNSEMSSDQKEFLMDTFYPQGVEGIEYGEGGAPVMPDQGSIDAEMWGDSDAIQEKFGEFSAFVMNNSAQDEFKLTEEQSVKGIAKDIGYGQQAVAYGAFDDRPKNIQKIYGSWENAMNAARMWAGDNASDALLKDLIMATL